MATNQKAGFDYQAIDEQNRKTLRRYATEIKETAKKQTRDIIEIGKRLLKAKEILKLKGEKFLTWLDTEFQWGEDTAERYMAVARAFAKNPHAAEFPPTVLSILALCPVPEEALQDAIKLAGLGGKVTSKVARTVKQRRGNKKGKKTGALLPAEPVQTAIPPAQEDASEGGKGRIEDNEGTKKEDVGKELLATPPVTEGAVSGTQEELKSEGDQGQEHPSMDPGAEPHRIEQNENLEGDDQAQDVEDKGGQGQNEGDQSGLPQSKESMEDLDIGGSGLDDAESYVDEGSENKPLSGSIKLEFFLTTSLKASKILEMLKSGELELKIDIQLLGKDGKQQGLISDPDYKNLSLVPR